LHRLKLSIRKAGSEESDNDQSFSTKIQVLDLQDSDEVVTDI